MLDGEKGVAIAKLMQLIVKIGEVNKAEKLIPIKSAQIAGVSYFTVGDSIFSFFDLLLKDKVKVSVPSWLNPAGMDRSKWRTMKIDEKFAKKQFEIIQNYEKMGIETTLSCTPYLIGYQPSYGENLAWSESSAVIMANGFFGARTNREGAPSSLAAAITGLTGYYGLHKTENRLPDVLIDVEAQIIHPSDFSALGYWFGKEFRGLIPFFSNIKNVTLDTTKMLASAMASAGSVAHFHIQNITPDAKRIEKKDIEEHTVFTENEKKEIYELYDSKEEKVDLVTIGCPHTSLDDLVLIESYLKNQSLNDDVEFWVFSSNKIIQGKGASNTIKNLESQGIKIFADTCMVVSPAVRDNFSNILTNSAKAAFYLSRDEHIKVTLLQLEKIIERVIK
jgi:predicted aconitase